ncbi:MAG: FimB/Mfa2 family fimbrial subunit [Tannerellaceae bacterium]|nr:FimB/Mfa2 family fimbrial subunit [Tannerellaceae bacterium]
MTVLQGCVEQEECPFNVQIVYRYDREGESGGKNVLPVYVSGIIQYIFDESNRLVAVDSTRADDHGRFVITCRLPAGRYTVSGWGNVRGASHVNDATALQETALSLADAPDADGLQGNSERLFYGRRSFTVERRGVIRSYVDMTHAHCLLSFSIWWKNASQTPPASGDFYLLLRDVPSRYGFVPGYSVQSGQAVPYAPGMDDYPVWDDAAINHIPLVHDDEQLATHRASAVLNDKTLRGEFVTYRLTAASHPSLSIYDGETPLVEDIDLHKFFTELAIGLDETLRQEYRIGIEIASGHLTAFMLTATTANWEEGRL